MFERVVQVCPSRSPSDPLDLFPIKSSSLRCFSTALTGRDASARSQDRVFSGRYPTLDGRPLHIEAHCVPGGSQAPEPNV